MRHRTTVLVFLAMALGVILGLLLEGASKDTLRWFDLVGTNLFVGALKMVVAPLILCSIVAGITSLPSFADAGRIGSRTLVYYLTTTTVAVIIGLALVLVLRPGHAESANQIREKRVDRLAERAEEYRTATGKDPKAPTERGPYLAWLLEREGREQGATDNAEKYAKVAKGHSRTTYDMFVQDIVAPLLTNPFKSLSEVNSLGIILWSILLALALMAVGAPAKPLVNLFQAGNEAMLKIVGWIMQLAPLAIFCLVTSVVAKNGLEIFETLGGYCATVVGGIAIHILFLLFLVSTVGRMSPKRFLSGIREAWSVAFATRSSAATLPITMRCVTERLGVRERVARFALPVGATMNMDGTALYEGVAVIFLLQIYGGMDDVGIALTAGVTLVIFITAVLASVGAAAVPDAGLITMVLVADAVHLPVYYIPLIFTVDALLDMFRTSTNIMGDAVGAVIVDRFETDAPPEPAAAPAAA
ncbi:MAG: dicarboxylate/amino acid:cation symporter [Planctomycetota bacterium]|nr:dicarboxylate/amino acid:cation symporter [Planctomycetota bacterium]MCB9824597.1 dicarboxylate/amino acid:cation symporter [Planctomycetota bacterium]MCB9899991.1 dicarboxylate/amino acid:cation symporter [Planctomycetota bacterium]